MSWSAAVNPGPGTAVRGQGDARPRSCIELAQLRFVRMYRRTMDANVAWQLEVVGEVGVSILLGGCIGFERELADKPAGLRTHMMMAAAATLLVALSDELLAHFGRDNSSDLVQADPMRIVGAVITSASIVAAGTIFRKPEEGAVEGLTTASSLVLTSAIGIAVALHQFVLAVACVVLVVVILRVLGWIEERLERKR